VYNENKSLQTSQPLGYFFIEKFQAFAKHITTHCHNWQPMYLPTDWPDLNPLERI